MILWIVIEILALILEIVVIDMTVQAIQIRAKISKKVKSDVDDRHYKALEKVNKDLKYAMLFLFFNSFITLDNLIINII